MEKENGMRVLIVDDDRVICQCLVQGIRWEEIGCRKPLVAYNGAAALRTAEREHPNIVISDIKMPVMDGKELCRRIYEQYPDTIFLFLSAYEDFAAAQMAIRYHVSGYVLKPLDREGLEALEKLIAELVAGRSRLAKCRQIAAGSWKGRLKEILEQHQQEDFEAYLAELQELQQTADNHGIDLYTSSVGTLVAYLCENGRIASCQAFELENRMLAKLSALVGQEKFQFFAEYCRNAMEEKQTDTGDVVLKVQELIRKQFTQAELNLNMIGEQLNMSPRYLGRIFLEKTGMKIGDYILNQRIAFSCEELLHTEKSVREIAHDAGYEDANYFAKVFKREKKMTPKEYIEKYFGGGSFEKFQLED